MFCAVKVARLEPLKSKGIIETTPRPSRKSAFSRMLRSWLDLFEHVKQRRTPLRMCTGARTRMLMRPSTTPSLLASSGTNRRRATSTLGRICAAAGSRCEICGCCPWRPSHRGSFLEWLERALLQRGQSTLAGRRFSAHRPSERERWLSGDDLG